MWTKERMVKREYHQSQLSGTDLWQVAISLYQSDEFINDKSWVIAGKALNPIGRRIANLDDADVARQDWNWAPILFY